MTRVVIDIPEQIMAHIMIQKVKLGEFDVICEAIDNGTILPKGHGDLIDRSKLDTRERGNNSQRRMWWNIKQIIENAPTVIEADKKNGND